MLHIKQVAFLTFTQLYKGLFLAQNSCIVR